MLLHNGRPRPLNVEQFGLHDMKVVEAGEITRNFIRQTVRQCVDRGLITRHRIRDSRLSRSRARSSKEYTAQSVKTSISFKP